MKENRVYFGGIPTDPEVNMLMERFGTPESGTLIAYEDVEATIGRNKGSSRFRSVTGAWRRRLFNNHNLVIECERNRGFKVMTAPRRIQYAEDETTRAGKKTLRALKVSVKTPEDELTDIQKKKKHLFEFRQVKVMEYHRDLKRKKDLMPPDHLLPKPRQSGDGSESEAA